MDPKLANIIIVNYNGESDLRTCLSSMLLQTYDKFDITVVDSGSSDMSAEIIEREFPQVRLIKENNIGYGMGNNRGIEATNGEYVIISNMDVEVDPNWLMRMIECCNHSDKIGIVTPKILLYEEREKINTCGNTLQFMGFGTCRGRGEPKASYNSAEEILCPSGASFLIKRQVLKHIGFFDTSIQDATTPRRTTQDYYQEADVAWRAWVTGYHVMFEPRALVYHKYVVKPLNHIRFMDLEINRLSFILSTYSFSTLVVLFPFLLFAEIVAFGFALTKGFSFVLAKFRAYGWMIKNSNVVKKKRIARQRLRQLNDDRIFGMYGYQIEFTHQTNKNFFMAKVENGLNFIFKMMYKTVKTLWCMRLNKQ